jgi:transposase InsO family protein
MEPRRSRKGHGWDHAVAERCFHTLKTACISLEDCETHEQAQTAVFASIDVFSNRQWGHSANGYLALLAYEQALKAPGLFCPEKC